MPCRACSLTRYTLPQSETVQISSLLSISLTVTNLIAPCSAFIREKYGGISFWDYHSQYFFRLFCLSFLGISRGGGGVVWCGVWCDLCVVWYGVVWCGVVRWGVVCGVTCAWCGMVRWWCSVVWCGMVWCGVVWWGEVWCVVWCDVMRVVWCGMVWCVRTLG